MQHEAAVRLWNPTPAMLPVKTHPETEDSWTPEPTAADIAYEENHERECLAHVKAAEDSETPVRSICHAFTREEIMRVFEKRRAEEARRAEADTQSRDADHDQTPTL